MSDEQKAKIGLKSASRTHTEETKKKISEKKKKSYADGSVIHPRKGQTFTDESKIKISNTLKRKYDTGEITSTGHLYHTPESRKKQGESIKKRYNSGELIPFGKGETKETNESIRLRGEKRKGQKHSPEVIKKMSKIIQEQYNNGYRKSWNKGTKKDPNEPLTEIEISRRKKISNTMREGIKNGDIKNPAITKAYTKETCDDLNHGVRSSWEANICRYLKFMDVNYEYESKYFEIDLGDKKSSYLPDLYIPKYDFYIEVKGHWRSDEVKRKTELFPIQYSTKLFLIDKIKYPEIINSKIYYTDFKTFMKIFFNENIEEKIIIDQIK